MRLCIYPTSILCLYKNWPTKERIMNCRVWLVRKAEQRRSGVCMLYGDLERQVWRSMGQAVPLPG
jgi:hypothetical protein